MIRFGNWRPAPFRATAALLLACYLPACTAWHTQSTPPQQVIATKQPRKLRVVRQDGSRIELQQPRIEGDSLVGTTGVAKPGTLLPRVAIALADVKAVEVHEGDTGKTLLLVGVIGAVMVAGALAGGGSTSWGGTTDTTIHSSPYVYSWDGQGWRLESGTYAGAIARGVARTDVTLLARAVPQGSDLRLQVSNELNETDFLDALAVLAVDHDPAVTVAPGPDGLPRAVGPLTHAVEARDYAGRDVAALLATADDRSWESRLAPRDTADPQALSDGVELVFPRPPEITTAQLVVDARNTSWAPFMLGWIVSMHGRATGAWYDSLAAYPDVARRYNDFVAREGTLRVSLRKGDGWVAQGVVTDPGPEVTRRQVVPLDLSGVDGPMVRVRIESAPSLWLIDHVAVAYGPEPQLVVHELVPASARTTEGEDVLPLVARADGREWVFEQRTRADVRFPLPRPVPGMARSYLVKTTGWYRIHFAEAGEPDVTTLDRMFNEPRAAVRISVSAINAALRVGATGLLPH
ncbi:MAG: hypothetical protein ACM37V_04175 [Gemmatimonadota bacterium]